MKVLVKVSRTIQSQLWWLVTVIVMVTLVVEVTSLSGPYVCMVKQKYNITKRVKYRAPMSVRTYEWCFAMPPRCSKWNTEMRDVTRLETEERTAEMAVCCPGYKLKDVSCVPICPNGKTGPGCSEDCPPSKWGPNCVHDCIRCDHGTCDVATGECRCQDGWQGESCETNIPTTAMAMMEQLLTTAKSVSSTKTNTTPTPIAVVNSSPSAPSRSVTEATATSTIASTTDKNTITDNKPVTTTSSVTSTIKKNEPVTAPTILRTKLVTTSAILNNVTLSTIASTKYNVKNDEVSTKISSISSDYNRTEIPTETTKVISTVKSTMPISPTISTEPTAVTIKIQATTLPSVTNISTTLLDTTPELSTEIKTVKETTTITVKLETSRKQESTTKAPTTKFKPKEIWIRPAQKGESSLVETKLRQFQELHHMKSKTKEISEITTPKTIVVSIIPTSVSYVTFKKLALSTVSSFAPKNASPKSYNMTDHEITKPISLHTTVHPITVKIVPRKTNQSSTINPLLLQNVTKTKSYTSSTRRTYKSNAPTNKTTNSMSSTLNVANKRMNSSILITTPSFPTNANVSQRRQHSSPVTSTNKPHTTVTAPYKYQTSPLTSKETITEHPSVIKQFVTIMQRNITANQATNPITSVPKVTKAITRKLADTNSKRNLTNTSNKTNTVTDDPTKDEGVFHILTEPEHITAVMNEKGTERSTMDLISVISIAGGIMMAVITVAVIIVMLERCKRPRYEDVRKYNNRIRMQVMIDNNDDIPPPYVRSIFHTPLPDPPIEKCHYQPISTLDRNLKQFMRPVVVQTISPLMLENFRGILECHYDHLPRRSQDMGTLETRCSAAPSIDEREELLRTRIHSLTDSDIEAMKCEAKLDVIDNTTSEPLYAEIPCWRPPSARAIEVVNLNGEAVTEL